MNGLKLLTLSHNKLKEIPELIEHLHDNLEKLDLSHNYIEYIPF